MPSWDHDDCPPAIEAEHHRLYRMMNRLEPVIVNSRDDSAVSRAIHILQQRMTDHFQVEEELFITADWGSRQVMIEDHRRLLNLLSQLEQLPPKEFEARRALFLSFLNALVQHDNDIDAPLFSRSH